MSAPILMNHDFTKAIGSVDVINGELHFRFATDVSITKDMAFEIFGNAGLQLFEASEVDGVMLIRSGRIVEFSLSLLPAVSAAPPTEPQPPAQVTDAMVHAADKAMFGKIVQGEARFETVRLGLEAAMATAGQRCKTCKHWSPLSKSCRDPEVAAGGICKSSKLVEDQGQGHGADMLVYRYSEGGEFWTGPGFGCVHHEERP